MDLLTTFFRNNTATPADLSETLGNIGLGLLRIGCGKTVTVEQISSNSANLTFHEKDYSLIIKITAMALFILALPVTLPFAIIGTIAMLSSNSHQQISNLYHQSKLEASKNTDSIQQPTEKDNPPTINPNILETATTTHNPIEKDNPPTIDSNILELIPETPTNPNTNIQMNLPITNSWIPRMEELKGTLSENTSIEALWKILNDTTYAIRHEIELAPFNKVLGRFRTSCAKKTILKSDNTYYMHANYMGEGIVQRPFVALEALRDGGDWKPIFESDDSTIFDLTTLVEKENYKINYYPTELNATMETWNRMKITLIKSNDNTHTYEIENENGDKKIVTRYHYANWPDGGVVSLDELRLLVEKAETLSPNPKNPLWVHCLAGLGRTGTLITALVLKEKIEAKEITNENLEASLVSIIIELRKQRRTDFVQTQDQLGLLRNYARFLLKAD